MEEKIVWKLVHWKMELLRDGWWGKPVYRVTLKYGVYRAPAQPETKWQHKDFKKLKDAFTYLEDAMEVAEKVKL